MATNENQTSSLALDPVHSGLGSERVAPTVETAENVGEVYVVVGRAIAPAQSSLAGCAKASAGSSVRLARVKMSFMCKRLLP